MQSSGAIQILNTSNAKNLNDVRNLISEFLKWQTQRHKEGIEFINE